MLKKPLLRRLDWINLSTDHKAIWLRTMAINIISRTFLGAVILITIHELFSDDFNWHILLLLLLGVVFFYDAFRTYGVYAIDDEKLFISCIRRSTLARSKIISCEIFSEDDSYWKDENETCWLIKTNYPYYPFNTYYLSGKPELELHKHLPSEERQS